MSWKSTGWLVSVALGLFAFIFFIERHHRPSSAMTEPPPRLLNFKPAEVTTIQIRRTNQFLLKIERTNQTWTLMTPTLTYPGQFFAVENLLAMLANLSVRTIIPLADLSAQRRSIAEFGLDAPSASVLLLHNGQRTEILLGSRTPVGDQVYLQLLNGGAIHVVSAEVLDRLPRSPNDWRDTTLINLGDLNPDRMEVRTPTRGFAIQADPTNNVFFLSKPIPARADREKVEALLRTVQSGQVTQFVTDDARAELEQFGLQPPEAELVFGLGTNDLVTVQFGKSPTNDPTTVYARRLSHTNIVLVPRKLLETVQTSHTDLRDRRLLTFSPAAVQSIEVVGTENFSVRRQTNGIWAVAESQTTLAEPDVIREWLDRLARLECTVEKDVVTDFASYGLATPPRQYILRSTATNGAGVVTNRVVAQLDIGARQGEKIFARRPDESSVYAITPAAFDLLPSAPWQLRDRRVWSFTTNQIMRVSVRQGDQTREFLRSPGGQWSFAPGSQGVINTFAIEEAMYRLGELRAAIWVARGDEQRARYGFKENGHRISIELKGPDKPYTLSVEFGGFAPSNFPYALATVEGQPWVFEFPLPLFFQIVRDLSNPALSTTAPPP